MKQNIKSASSQTIMHTLITLINKISYLSSKSRPQYGGAANTSIRH